MAPSHTENLITTKEAGEIYGYTPDYLARLARAGKISGKRVGHSWIIECESLESFIARQDGHKIDYARALARARETEYREHRAVVRRATRALMDSMPMPHKHVAIVGKLHSQALALSVALLVVVMGALGARAATDSRLALPAIALANEAAAGFGIMLEDGVARVAMRIEQAGSERDARSRSVASAIASASANTASPLLAHANFSLPSLIVLDESPNQLRSVLVTLAAHPDTVAFVPITIEDAIASVLAVYEFITTPSLSARSLARAHTALGENAYSAILASLSAYRSLIERAGGAAFSRAVVSRDALATAPRLVGRTNLVLGEAIIAFAHVAIRADVTFAYWTADYAPASARSATGLALSAGDALSGAVSRAPALAAALYLRATAAPAELAPRLARAVFGAEYAIAARFVALAERASGSYLALVEGAGRLAYSGTERAETLVPTSTRLVSGLAAVVNGLSAGERAALATYETLSGFMRSAQGAFAAFFAPSPTIVMPSLPAGRQGVAVATSTPRAAAPAPRTVNSYPTYTTVVQGVSSDVMNRSLATLRADILATAAGMIQPVAAQSATNVTTIQQVNMIQDLSNLIVRNGDFRGGVFDNGERVSAKTGTFTNLNGGSTALGSLTVSGATSLATTTITGTLAVSGTTTPGVIAATDYISAPYFVATSAAATSTFAGALAVDTDGFVYATTTRNVGIGVLSPAALLALRNSTSTQPLFVASNAAGAEVYRITNAGFVGIGTTTPGHALAVEGSSSLGNQAIAGYFTATTSTVTSTLAGSLAVGTSTPFGNGLFIVGTSTPLLHIASNSGFVGIGTSTPSDTLALNGAMYLAPVSAPASSAHRLYNVADDLYWAGNIIGGATTGHWTTDGTHVWRPGGNVGIATTSPYAKLSVVGQVVASHFTATTSTASTFPYASSTAITVSGASYFGGQLNLTGTSANIALGSNYLSGDGGDEGIFVSSTGNVGIGTTNSTANLNIASSGANPTVYNPSSGVGIILRGVDSVTTGQLRIVPNGGAWADSTETTYFQITNGSNNNATFMGGTYGTDTQLSRLQFNSLLTTVTDLVYGSTPVPTALFELINSTTSKVPLKIRGATSQSGDYININSVSGSGGNILALGSSGNLGIGTTSPYAKLSVVGEAVASHFTATSTTATSTFSGGFTAGNNAALSVNQAASANSLYIAANGNVGVGTTSPSTKFSVGGVAGDATGHGYFTGGLGVGVVNTVAGTFQTTGAATFGGALTVNGQCVTADTRLRRRRRRADGSYEEDEVMIKDIEEGDEVATLDQKTGTFTWSRVKALVDTGIQPLIRITTQSGREIDTTVAHPYLLRTAYPTKTTRKMQKLYRFEVDLSTKVEDLGRDTVVAIASVEGSFTVVIPRKVKQALRDLLRSRFPRELAPTVYAMAIVEGLRRMETRVHELVIDIDYYGHDDVIARIVRSAFPHLEIMFARVGKKSLAHFATYGVHTKQKIADHAATFDDLLRNAESAIPASSPAHKGAGFDSHQALSSTPMLVDRDAFVKTGKWTPVGELKIGQEIAVAYGNTPAWERIVKMEEKPPEQVYDIEIEGTHNFIGNDIVAHNTAVFNQASSTMFTNSGATWLTSLSANSLLATDANKMLISTTSIGVSNLALAKGNFLVGNDAGVSQATSTIFISSTGNVGIGTTSPAGLLSVSGSSGLMVTNTGSAYTAYFEDAANDTSPVVIDTAGNVGIGTTGPVYKLEVTDAAAAPSLNPATGIFRISSGPSAVTGLSMGILPTDPYGAWIQSTNQPSTAGGTYPLALNPLGGNVGIGTTSPAGLLSVSGSSGLMVTNTGTAYTAYFEDAANDTSPVVIDTAGNVGIGTTSPGAPLDVNVAGNLTIATFGDSLSGADNQRGHRIQLWGGSAYFDTKTNSGGRIYFRTGEGTETVDAKTWMTVDPTQGNVGIGTTSPAGLLSVSGSSGLMVTNTGTAYTAYFEDVANDTSPVVIDTSGNVGIGTTSPGAPLDVNVAGNLTIATFGDSLSGADNQRGHRIQLWGGSAYFDTKTNSGGRIYFRTGEGTETVDAKTWMTVDPTQGNVGIGTTGPGQKLDVVGSAQITPTGSSGFLIDPVSNESVTKTRLFSSGAIVLQSNFTTAGKIGVLVDKAAGAVTDTTTVMEINSEGNATAATPVLNVASGGTSLFRVQQSGNVGIGTTSPWAKLSVTGASDLGNFGYAGYFTATSTTATSTFSGGFVAGNNAAFSVNQGATANSLYIATNGNIGIGTTSPAGLLSVSGSSGLMVTNTGTAYTAYFEDVANDTSPVVIDTNGNVGIGTTTPSSLLSVHGNSYVSGSSFFGGAMVATSTLNVTGLTTLVNASTTQLTTTGSTYLATTNGNVGIGTTGPARPLEIAHGNAAGTDYVLRLSNSDATGYGAGLEFYSAYGSRTLSQIYAEPNTTGANLNFLVAAVTTNTLTSRANINSSGYLTVGGSTGQVSLFSVQGGVAIGNSTPYWQAAAPTGGAIIEGNVGIGTTSPWAKLSVTGASDLGNFGYAGYFTATSTTATSTFSGGFVVGNNAAFSVNQGATANSLYIATNGNVGIGTTAPGTLNGVAFSTVGFHVKGTGVSKYIAIDDSNNVGMLLNDSSQAADSRMWAFLNQATRFSISTFSDAGAPSEKVTVLRSGNVGIGTTSPAGLLSVSGSSGLMVTNTGSAYTAYFEDAANDTSPVVIDTAGNVGIGTAGPVAALSIKRSDGDWISLHRNDGLEVWTLSGEDVLTLAGNVHSNAIVVNRADNFIGLNTATNPADNDGPQPTSVVVGGAVGSGYASFNVLDTTSVAAGVGGAIDLWGNITGTSIQTAGARIRALKESSGSRAFGLALYTHTDGGAGVSYLQEAMRINSTGNVGIGTTGPTQKLEVYSSSGSNYIRSARASQGAGQVGYVVGGGTSGVDWLMYQNTSSDNLSFYGGGADRVTINSTGNVGIGTTGPGASLDVRGTQTDIVRAANSVTTSAAAFRANANGGNAWFGVESSAGGSLFPGTDPYAAVLAAGQTGGKIQLAGADGVRMTVLSGGNVGIGTTTPGAKLDVYGGYISAPNAFGFASRNTSGTLQQLLTYADSTFNTTGNELIINNQNNNSIRFRTNGSEKVIFDNNGNVGIGTTSPATLLEVGGASANVTFDGYKNCTGFTSNGNGLLACTASDQRLKQDIAPLDGASVLASLDTLNPVSFYWQQGADRGTGQQFGLIAQEVQGVFPNLVVLSSPSALTPDGTLSVNYEGLISPMILAIQELNAKVRQIEPFAAVLSIAPGVESQCVTGDTRLRRRRRRADGSFEFDEIEIKNVEVGDEVASLDEAAGVVVYSRVNALVDMGEQEVYELVTKSGRSIRTTSNHPFLVRMGGPQAQENLGTGTATFFTPVKKSGAKTTGFISRLLGQFSNIDETHAISGAEIRDTALQTL